MTARLNLFGSPLAGKVFARIGGASKAVFDSGLIPKATQDLVLLRVSQINGCAYCTDVHSKDLLHAGESAERVSLVAVWREATVFTDAEKAALELTEEGTRIADTPGGVSDEAWTNAAKHYDDDQLGALVALISMINTWNRLNVITRQPAGDYVAGSFG